jgi:PIN domain nuclease of toxin-antitoxin system
MRILLDTHDFLWYVTGDERMPPNMLGALRDPQNTLFLSVVSLWEATIKYQLGKLALPESPERYLPLQRQQHQILSLELDEPSVGQLINLPALHRDPFDRILVCQAAST